eukprot:TRINITY_DN5371_c0_g1_i1.p1 TRINITY_DN5371_c0_g1~~TRINITY_DN5371_c0_g1_i1.p1  ORF type:complete len:181 (+),score=48.10 TRINITY_DN5371_c0_g1_i1:150-692(+)
MTRIHDLTADLARAGKTCKEIREIVEAAYPGQSLSVSQTHRLIKTMKEGGDLSDKRGLATTRTVRTPGFIDAVRIAIESDRKLSLSQLAACHRASKATMLKILRKDLGLRKEGERWVPINPKKSKISKKNADIKCEVEEDEDSFDESIEFEDNLTTLVNNESSNNEDKCKNGLKSDDSDF